MLLNLSDLTVVKNDDQWIYMHKREYNFIAGSIKDTQIKTLSTFFIDYYFNIITYCLSALHEKNIRI